MIRVDKETAKALLGLHGWLGVALGLLLYVVILTGTLAVFKQELAQWAKPLPAASESAFPEGMGALLQDISARVDPAYLEEVFVFPAADGRVKALFHAHGIENEAGERVEQGVLALIDPTGLAIIEEHEGEVGSLFEKMHSSAFTDFLVELHVRLLLPGQWGLFLTGLLGFAMLAAVVSGFIVHRHLLKDLFTLRRRKDALLTARDVHVVAASWNLPFAFLLAFTGAFFSFGGAIGLPAIAFVAFGGDVETLTEEVLSPPVKEDASPAPLGDLDKLLADARERTGQEPTAMQILHWGRADATVQMSMTTEEGRLLPDHLLYGGATGEFKGVKPTLGQERSFGGDLAGLMSPLHFGNFAGLLSKAIWFAFGFAGAYVAFSGLRLWTTRRREQGRWLAFDRATLGVGYGLPIALACAAGSFLLGGSPGWAFFIGATACALVALGVKAPQVGERVFLLGLACLLALLPLLRWLGGGELWGQAPVAVASVDVLLLIAAAICGRGGLRKKSSKPDPRGEQLAVGLS